MDTPSSDFLPEDPNAMILCSSADGAILQSFPRGALITRWQPAGHPHPLLWCYRPDDPAGASPGEDDSAHPSGRVSDSPTSSPAICALNPAVAPAPPPANDACYPERGGIPICFPWIGAGRGNHYSPHHGLVRNAPWRLGTEPDSEGMHIGYRITADDVVGSEESGQWSAQLHAQCTSDTLSLAFTVHNIGSQPMSYEATLHTYLAVSDVRHITLHGCDNTDYLDATTTPYTPRTHHGPLHITDHTDSVFHSSDPIDLIDPQWERRLHITKEGSADTIVWNPGPELGAQTRGVGPQQWRHFICVEAANFRENAIWLAPDESHTLRQHIQLISLAES
ncbi:hypothetical protein [Trueperella sp. LYQ143]|uniref:aldose epimerase family protein n=1 Tax=Trueperella sp. LYQ143 TaxID=3391059 RepID=UPI00398323D4